MNPDNLGLPGIEAKGVMQMLRHRYESPEWVFVTEVGNAGSASSRYADAVAINTWSSRGYEVHGFEIKQGRGDWLAELKSPSKSERVMKYCDRWWLVVSDPNIIRLDELPKGWGLLIPSQRNATMRVKTQAPILEPLPASRGFIASMLRRAMQQSAIQKELDDQFQRGRVAGRTDTNYELKQADRHYKELKSNIQEFENASGLKIEFGYQLTNMGKAVQHIMHNGTPEEIMARLLSTARSTVRLLEKGEE